MWKFEANDMLVGVLVGMFGWKGLSAENTIKHVWDCGIKGHAYTSLIKNYSTSCIRLPCTHTCRVTQDICTNSTSQLFICQLLVLLVSEWGH